MPEPEPSKLIKSVDQSGRRPFVRGGAGRLDGLSSTKSSVDGKLPAPFFNLDQLNKIFAANGLSQADMIALSGTYGNNKRR